MRSPPQNYSTERRRNSLDEIKSDEFESIHRDGTVSRQVLFSFKRRAETLIVPVTKTPMRVKRLPSISQRGRVFVLISRQGANG